MLKIGSLVDGKYKILSEIGHGGMSVVYMAINEKANKTWAIKEVRKDGIKDFEVVKQGLIVETELLKKLKHPNLPSIIDVIEDDQTLLIVMDYIEGQPLSKALEEFGAQSQQNVIEWAKQLCDVLGYLHTRVPPIIYRDMKPANIMLKPDGNLTLIDFGTAREYKDKNLADTTCLGTIGYAAPEQFGGQGQTDARTDIYCLGATLYHLVTGCNPCEPPYEIKPIREIDSSLSSGLEKIIQKCTQKNPNDRYQSCAELMYDLQHYEEIDSKFKNKQKRKLISFTISIVLTIIFVINSAVGYAFAEQKKGENYDYLLVEASKPEISQDERVNYYLSAIKLNENDERAYKDMLELFLSGNEAGGSFSRKEASTIMQLKAGIDIKNFGGYTDTTHPLENLKKNNPKGYSDVCYEIGVAYWYDYEIESERYSSAVEWFQQSVKYYPVAQIYCDIGQCQQQIKKYAGQNRTEKMYETYQTLWKKLVELKQAASKTNDSDTKIMVWSEIVNTISNKADYFIVNTNKKDILTLLDSLSSEAGSLKRSTKYVDVKKNIDQIVSQEVLAKERVEAAAQ